MPELCKLPNIGKVLERRLNAVGVDDTQTLMELGSKQVFVKLNCLEKDTCFNTLCALEGAIQGVRWHYLSSEAKEDLKKFFDSFEK